MSDVTVVVEDPSVTVRLDPNGVVAAYFAGLTNNRLIKTSSGAPADSLIAQGTITGALTVSKSGSTAREVTFPDADLTVAGTNVAQTYTAVQTYTTGLLVAADVKASGSGGLALKSSNGTTVATFGAGPGTGTTLAGGLNAGATTLSSLAVSDLTSGRVTYAGASGELVDSSGLTFDGTQFTVGDGSGNNRIAMNAALANAPQFRWMSAGARRFEIHRSATGEDWQFYRLTGSAGAESVTLIADYQRSSSSWRFSPNGTTRLTIADALITCAAPLTLSGSNALTVGGGITHGSATLLTTTTALTNGAGASAGTLTNAPSAGDPTKWIPIDDNGTTRYIPAW